MNNLSLVFKTALIGALSKEMPKIFYYSEVPCKHVSLLWKETTTQLIYLAALTLKLKSSLTPEQVEKIDKKHRSTSKFKRVG